MYILFTRGSGAASEWSLAFGIYAAIYAVLSGVLIRNKGALCASLLITYATPKLLTPYPTRPRRVWAYRVTKVNNSGDGKEGIRSFWDLKGFSSRLPLISVCNFMLYIVIDVSAPMQSTALPDFRLRCSVNYSTLHGRLKFVIIILAYLIQMFSTNI